MNSKPVVALAFVSEDIQIAYDYFDARLNSGGEKFLERYFTTTDQIALNPGSFAVKFGDYHRALIPKSDFAIYYYQKTDRSVIVAVVNARRHPRSIRNFVRNRRQ